MKPPPRSKWLQPQWRAAYYVALLVALNCYFALNLFRVEFTYNMQTNAGSFMAISRFILQHWPHLGWFPWWFNGEPFENTYTPLLPLADAAFAWITGSSTARAYNFVTGGFYVLAPVFLFLFAWRLTRFLETGFFAALIFSLFSPSTIFPLFRELGWWGPWRLRVLAFYGEGPHITVVSTLPLALLLVYLAITTRRYLWCAAAAVAMACLTLVNAFGAVDLGVGCVCLLLALPRKAMPKAGLLVLAMAAAAYLLAGRFMTPTFLRTMAVDSQTVGGVFHARDLAATWALILPGFVFLCFAVRAINDYFTRFILLFTYLFFEIVGMFAIAGRAALPQPDRYSLELELGLALVVAFGLRKLVVRFPAPMKAFGILLIAFAAFHQTVHYRRYARVILQEIDIRQTIEYRTAQWIGNHLGGLRVFGGAETGTWLNVFVDTPQMNSGHRPFNPNFAVEESAIYEIYSSEGAGSRDAEVSVLWLKAFGCHAIYVPGPQSRVATKPFVHPYKFEGVLPVLWHEEDDTIYGVPQRTKSLAHVVSESAIVQRQPIHGLDTDEVARYVAALDDPTLPADVMTWTDPNHADPNHGHIDTTLHPGQVLSIQTTYDKGWIARANGKPAEVTRDGIGLSVIHAPCDGPCSIDFVFTGGFERHFFNAVSSITIFALLLGGFFAYRKGKLV
jgi:hypothetical protein